MQAEPCRRNLKDGVPLRGPLSVSILQMKAFRECGKCKTPLVIIEAVDRQGAAVEIAVDEDSRERHVCWDLPEDANLLVVE